MERIPHALLRIQIPRPITAAFLVLLKAAVFFRLGIQQGYGTVNSCLVVLNKFCDLLFG